MNGEIRVRVNSFGEGRNLSMVYHDPITGKKVARSAGTRDMKEALRKAGVWEAELREGRYHAPSKITWAEFRTRHATERLDALAEKTRNICECALDRLERTIHPDRLEKVTAAVLSRFAAQLRKEGLGEVSIGAYLGHLKAAFRWAESVGMLREAPRVNMPKRAKGKRGRASVPSWDEILFGATKSED